jgi:23S rRNA (uracil1939-C5)-methyltransferase
VKAELLIKGIASQGDGVAELDGRAVFVPFTAPGDTVRAEVEAKEKGGLSGEVLEILEPGAARAEPPCRHFTDCGGCALQHVTADFYRDWLRQRIETALSHQGLTGVPFETVHVSPPRARRRLSLRAVRKGNEIALGFNRWHSHEVVDVAECPVADRTLVDLFPAWRETLSLMFKDVMFFRLDLTKTAAGVDAVLHLMRALSGEERAKLGALVAAMKLARLSVFTDGAFDTALQNAAPFIEVDGMRLQVPEGAFLQATPDGEAALANWLKENAKGVRKILDLFCGIGTFTLPLAKGAAVTAADADKRLLDALSASARNAKGLKPVAVEHRDLYRRPFLGEALKPFDCAVFDPPRAGAEEQARAFAASKVKRVLAVSCNPNTFARDAKILAEGGFTLSAVKPVGQFLWSAHVELAARFDRA